MIIIIKLCVCVCAIEQWATTRRTMDSIYSVYHLPYNLYICLYARRLKHQHFFPSNWGFLMTRSNLIQFTQFNVMIINPRASIKMLRFLLIRWDTTKKKKENATHVWTESHRRGDLRTNEKISLHLAILDVGTFGVATTCSKAMQLLAIVDHTKLVFVFVWIEMNAFYRSDRPNVAPNNRENAIFTSHKFFFHRQKIQLHANKSFRVLPTHTPILADPCRILPDNFQARTYENWKC